MTTESDGPARPTLRPLMRWITNFLDPLIDPLRWTDLEKALLIVAIQPIFVVPVAVRAFYLVENPAIEPYFDRYTLRAVAFTYAAYGALIVVLGAVGALLRARGRTSRAYVHVVVQLWWLLSILGAYLHGPATSPFWVVVPMLGFTALLLFDSWVAGAGLVTGLAFLFGTTLAERMGWIPYAPIFLQMPLVDGRVSDEWILGNLIWPAVLSVITFGILGYMIDRERRQAEALAQLTRRLEAELRDAADYVRSILPAESEEHPGISADACFVPSAQLGGDAFTWLWLDERRFAIALLDVCGHGVGAALHGVSAIQAIRRRRLSGVDMTEPGAVVGAMNDGFPMDEHGGLFLTLWYGVYDRETRRLRYASGGHPPAILRTGPDAASAKALELGRKDPIVGVLPGVSYGTAELQLDAYAELFVISDGAFEIEGRDGRRVSWNSFKTVFSPPGASPGSAGAVLTYCRELTGREAFDDDVSIIHLRFA